MDTFDFDFERFKTLCEAYGATITEGDQGITVAGKQMSGKEIFSDTDITPEYVFSFQQGITNCTIKGLNLESNDETIKTKLALLAA